MAARVRPWLVCREGPRPFHGFLGLRVPAADFTPAALRRAVQTVMTGKSFGEAARRFQRIIAEGNGLAKAADTIETVLNTGQPVLRTPAA